MADSKSSASFSGRLLAQAAAAVGVPFRFQAVVLPAGPTVSAAAAAWGAALSSAAAGLTQQGRGTRGGGGEGSGVWVGKEEELGEREVREGWVVSER